jgi:hypothetical protein
MKGIELLALGLRLVGIYGVLKGIQTVGVVLVTIKQITMTMPDEDLVIWYLGFGVSALLYILVVLLLIIAPAAIANKLMPRGNEQAPLIQVGAFDIQVIAFTVLGVYVLSWSIPGLIQNVVVLWNMTHADNFYNSDRYSGQVIRTVTTVIEMAIGIYLTFQASGLSRFLMMIRGLGYRGLNDKNE